MSRRWARRSCASGETVDERRRALIAKIGENISVRRFERVESTGLLGSYLHGTRIGTLVAIEGGDAALAQGSGHARGGQQSALSRRRPKCRRKMWRRSATSASRS